MTLEEFNKLSEFEAKEILLKCCASKHWALRMVEKRPFGSFSNLIEESENIWGTLEKVDYLEAFSAHPKIGQLPEKGRHETLASDLSKQEQSSVQSANSLTLKELEVKNNEYFEKFGFIFIVCATGKSADQMLQILNERIKSSYTDELIEAATQQLKITNIRLRKLIYL